MNDSASPLAAFSDDYASARAKFLALAAARNAQLRSIVHPTERGAQGEELAIDIATFGDLAAEKTLLLISGTHGQEGFIGSAIQIAFLRDLAIPEGVNVVAIHAVNPWGFSHLSRTDERNIDVNRNFQDFSAPLPRNELYAKLFPAICPDDWDERTIDWGPVREALVREHGWPAVLSAAGGGQFSEPTGLNYGGDAPSWSNAMLAEHLPPILANARKVGFVEWHTGLGGYGELCYINFDPPGSARHERVFDWMGEAARETFKAAFASSDGQTPSYMGALSSWLPSTAPDAEWAGLVIEVGTYETMAVFDALRIDRWLKFGRGSASVSREELRRTMLERLFPASPEWRWAGLERGCDAQRRALAGLQRW